jgi:TetR/AcrR family fatty acid metabolism transcriptional regulator
MSNQTKKATLLQVASRIFAAKGFDKTTISEIAKAADIAESTMYEHFKGKEALLFQIPIEKTMLQIENLEEHLQGLKGADNKLRKLIWHYLNFQENNQDYAKIILFELRPNRRFYKSEAYNCIKDYNRIVIDIIKEGMEEGIFRGNANIQLFRNLIFGTLDHVIYRRLVFSKPESIVDQVDALLDLFLNAIRPENWEELISANIIREDESDLVLDKGKLILKVAEKVFAEKGFDKARIADISKALGIGEGTFYEYFKNKEDLLFSIPLQRTKFLINSLNKSLMIKREAEMKLINYVWHYLSFLQSNKAYVAILLFELRPNRKFYDSEPYQVIREYSNILIEILRQGQKEETFRKDADIYLVRDLIFGSIDHTALTWVLFGKPSSLLGQADEMMRFFLKAIKCDRK